jgi:hypothetical protein
VLQSDVLPFDVIYTAKAEHQIAANLVAFRLRNDYNSAGQVSRRPGGRRWDRPVGYHREEGDLDRNRASAAVEDHGRDRSRVNDVLSSQASSIRHRGNLVHDLEAKGAALAARLG